MSTPDYDVVVVGGGLAGLVTAWQLDGVGFRTVVLEASNELGGRTINERVGDNIVHLGAEFVGRRQLQYLALVRSLGLSLKENPANVSPARWLLPSGEVFLGTFPRMSWSEAWKSLKLFIEVSWLASRVPVAQPWTAQRAPEFDAVSLEDWLSRRRVGINLRDAIVSVVEGEMAAPASEISLLFILWLVSRSRLEGLPTTPLGVLAWMALRVGPFIWKALRGRLLGGPGNPLEISLNSLNYWIVEGTQEVCLRLAKRLHQGKVLLNMPVVRVTQSSTQPEVEVETRDGSRYRGKYAVLAIPLPQLKKLHFDPPSPAPIRDLLNDLDYGRVSKVNLVSVGGAPPQPQFALGWKDAPLAWTRGHLVVSLCPNEASELEPAALLKSTAAAYGFDLPANAPPGTLPTQVLPPAYARVQNWNRAPFVGGSYINFRPGQLTRHGPHLKTPHGRVYFAGSERSSWPNFMAGAVESGYEVAATLTTLLRRQAAGPER